MQAHCQSPASHNTVQSFVKELANPTQDKIVFKKIPDLQKNKKRNAQPDTDRQNSKQTMTLKPNTDNGLQERLTRTPAPNSTYKKLAVQWLNEVQFFNQTFVQVDSFVLRNRQLLIAANR